MEIGCYIAIGMNVWARGETPEAARKKANIKKNDTYLIYACADPTTEVDQDGCIVYASKYPKPATQLVAKYKKGKEVSIE